MVVVDLGAPEPETDHSDDGVSARPRNRLGVIGTNRCMPAAAGSAPIDHGHLSRYTLGNRALELEVLGLFASEAPRTLARLAVIAECEGAGGKAWADVCHTLKGSARAVGAFKVAEAAAVAETSRARDVASVLVVIAAVTAAVAEVSAYIAAMEKAS